MKNNFKVGDIVKGKPNNGYRVTNENMIEGKVTGVFGDMIDVKALKFKEGSSGLHCGFRVRANAFELVKPIKEEAIVIYRKGNKVYALDKQTGEKASAKCHREDEFDFKKGAEIAFNRLLGKDVVSKTINKFKVGDKVRILDGSDIPYYRGGYCSTMKQEVGKIYEIREIDNTAHFGELVKGYRLKGSTFVWDERGLEKVSEFEASLPTLKDDERVVKQEKYEVGDRVKIVDKFTSDCCVNNKGHMDKYQGKVLTICKTTNGGDYHMVEDDRTETSRNEKWFYNKHCIEGKVVKKHTFEIGDMVRLKHNYMDVPKGAIGEVVYHDSDETDLIDFKVKYPNCHTGRGRLPEHTGLWFGKHDIEKV